MMRIVLVVVAVLSGLFLLGYLAFQTGLYTATPPHRGHLALTGVTVIDGTGTLREDAVIVIRDDRLQAVGPAEEIALPPDATILDLRGLTALPGLIDGYLLFGAPEVESVEDYRKLSLPALIWEALRMAPGKRRALLEQGVTTIASVEDVYPWILRVKRAIAEGRLEGPRVLAAGPTFTASGGHPAGTIYRGNPYLIENATRQVADPEEARREVGRVAQGGVDFISVVYDGGGERSPFGKIPRLDPEVLQAIVDAAHERGLKVIVRWGSPAELREAVERGVDGIVSVGTVAWPEDLIHRVAERGLPVIPALVTLEALAPPALLEVAYQNVKRLAEAGVPLVLGTGAGNPGVPFGKSVHRELERWVQAGLPPRTALQAATKNAAEFFGIIEEVGTLTPGKSADLIVVAGNPLEDIRALQEIRLVIKGAVNLEGGP